MRFGENALTTIERVKEKLAEVEAGLPEGVVITPVYDRSATNGVLVDDDRSRPLESVPHLDHRSRERDRLDLVQPAAGTCRHDPARAARRS
ncbi:MAG TPA: hypothetical protein VMM18_03470 [Gemmatimonadaceae bacterium]|nr:hypothetical protein [Gemmatimonadaceae bacterium]